MTYSRLDARLPALFALLVLCAVAATPARAFVLTLSDPTPIDADSFFLTLSSNELVTNVDYFTVTLNYSALGQVTLTNAELGPALPPVSFPTPGWTIAAIGDTLVQATYNTDALEGGAVPAGELVKLTFDLVSPASATTISAAFLPSNIDGDLFPEPVPSNTVSVTAVPEPSSWLLLAGGLALLGACVKRRCTA